MKMDGKGEFFLSMKFLASMVVFAMVVATFYILLEKTNTSMEEEMMEKEVMHMVTIFREMINGDARDVGIGENFRTSHGERRKCNLNLPPHLIYLGIGTDPDPDNDGEFHTRINGKGNAIVYKIEGGRKRIIWMEGIELRIGEYRNKNWRLKIPPEGLIITQGGEYEITFELVKYKGEKFILIYANNTLPY